MSGAHDPLTAALEDRLRFETLVADLASHFVNLDSNLIDGAIQDAQRRLVEALGLDRSSLFQFSETDGALVFTHYWSRPDLPPPDAGLMTADSFPWIRAQVMRGDVVAISGIDDIPAGYVDREHLTLAGTKSTAVVPLLVSGRVIGALTFGAMRAERTWPPELINRLCLIGHVFTSALSRKQAESELRRVLDDNARLRERLTEENVYLQHEMKVQRGPSDITGQSAAISRLLEQIAQVAPTGATVLLLGETGTGKELVARTIHEQSPRGGRAMVGLNCGAIPATLIESELFGAEKGAFTGAVNRQIGRFELADGSTIFLDEIGELPGETQVKLLRVLQEREIERLGSPRSIKIDVRVIAATNLDLDRAVADGRFREDLYYRLNVFSIGVPPLRERAEDIPQLAWTFVQEFSRAMGKRFESISKEHMAALQRYAWPGNVRELRNVIERAVIVSSGPSLKPELPRAKLSRHPGRLERLDDVEREHIRAVLERTAWRIRGTGGAAEVLGLKPSTLEGRMTKLDLRRPSGR
jgi:formate hydrogenlyase transcriptional activator